MSAYFILLNIVVLAQELLLTLKKETLLATQGGCLMSLFAQASEALAGRDSPFGVLMVLPADIDRHVASLKRAKVRWVGLDIPLSGINPREGVYHWDWSGFETALRALKRGGLWIMLKFLGQADWVSREPGGAHADWDPTLNLTPPRDRAKWQEVVRSLVQRYGAYCEVWQIGNEPDGGGYFRGSGKDYLVYLEWTVQAIRSVQKHCTVVAGELFRGAGVRGYSEVLPLLLSRSDLFDVLSVHYPLAPPEHAGGMDEYRLAMQRAGVRKPVWNTEQSAGASCRWGQDGISTHPRTQGALALSPIKAYGHCLALGIAKVFLMSWNYHDSGLFYRDDLQTEYRTMVEQLEGARFVGKVETGSRDFILYRFARGSKHLLLGWSEVKGKQGTVQVTGDHAVRVVEYDGQSRSLSPRGGGVQIPIGFCPRFVWLPNPAVGVRIVSGAIGASHGRMVGERAGFVALNGANDPQQANAQRPRAR